MSQIQFENIETFNIYSHLTNTPFFRKAVYDIISDNIFCSDETVIKRLCESIKDIVANDIHFSLEESSDIARMLIIDSLGRVDFEAIANSFMKDFNTSKLSTDPSNDNEELCE
jgi:hypothetical protein